MLGLESFCVHQLHPSRAKGGTKGRKRLLFLSLLSNHWQAATPRQGCLYCSQDRFYPCFWACPTLVLKNSKRNKSKLLQSDFKLTLLSILGDRFFFLIIWCTTIDIVGVLCSFFCLNFSRKNPQQKWMIIKKYPKDFFHQEWPESV